MLPRRKNDHFVFSLLRVHQGLYIFLQCQEIEQAAFLLDLYFVLFFFCHFFLLHPPLIRYQGHVLAKELVKRGVQSTIVTDSAVFAMISRVNMVIMKFGHFFSSIDNNVDRFMPYNWKFICRL